MLARTNRNFLLSTARKTLSPSIKQHAHIPDSLLLFPLDKAQQVATSPAMQEQVAQQDISKKKLSPRS